MSLNKSKGNMYPWVTHTWNPIRGKCPHGCVYCFMKGKNVGPLRLDEKAMADNLGTGRTIFVGSSTDMWAVPVPHNWIWQVLQKCNQHDNTYIFQSKDPGRFCHGGAGSVITAKFPPRTILGTTLETNRGYGQGYAGPPPWARVFALASDRIKTFRKMVSIEPVMEFDLPVFLSWLEKIGPEFVSVGADSKGHNLIEPTSYELKELIAALSPITEIKLKKNLDRLLEPK